ncbi:amino acid adenylation domain-containing protein [Clostridium botulinum]|uniref:amino acid adenylation domain-containing protein n=1 Tax=Clostridium botulinum TaxID=1491 RepID=UPI001A9AF955|nr:amino acid adenylation domain-containing protein [Clostridium botulinum]
MKNTKGLENQKLLHSFFLESATRYPDSYGLSIGEQKWTYAEIEYQARCWANALLEGSSQQVCRVGIFASRSYVAYVGVLASLFSGSTYVPLNRRFPLKRTLSMIKQAELDAIIVDEQSFAQLQDIIPHLENHILILSPKNVVNKSGPPYIHFYDKLSLEHFSPLKELSMIKAEAIAYILFTSGSTGQPKGVPITHRNVVSFLEYNISKYQFTPEDRFTQTFDLTFDLSVFDLFMSWGSGGCICVMQPIELLAPFQFLTKHKVTVWFSVPSVIALYRKKQLLKKNYLPTLKWSLFCGEALTQSSVEAWQEAAPQSKIENLYGPTELTIACSAYRWDSKHSPNECVNGIAPIGKIYDHLNHIVIDEKLTPVNAGEAGELCVSGSQMFCGYWNNIEQTSKRFIRINSIDYYRTGDMVKWKNDNYVYLGRIDHQTKIQGFRIELGEIESVIRRNNNVVEAAAIAWPIENGKAQGIVAFVSGSNIKIDEINQICRAHLPHYMQPHKVYILNDVPYNTNGKIDYNALRLELSEVC